MSPHRRFPRVPVQLADATPSSEIRSMVTHRFARRTIAGIGLAALLTACVGDKGVAPSVTPASAALGAIHLSPLNAVMAVGDTLSLTVTGRTLTGESISQFDSVQYMLQRTVDTVRARVSAAGLLTAVGASDPGDPVLVQVVAFKGGLARADVAVVTVVDSRFTGAALSIQPIPPDDSAVLALGMTKPIVATIRNPSTGMEVPTPRLRLEYSAADSAKILCYLPSFVVTGSLTVQQLQAGLCPAFEDASPPSFDWLLPTTAGTAWVHASVTVFGVPLQDSVQYTFTNAISGLVMMLPTNLGMMSRVGTSLLLAPGATVTFINNFDPSFGVSVDFAFDQPSAASAGSPPATVGDSAGNITPLGASGSTTRRFLTPGVYHWTATAHGGPAPFPGATAQGTITVR